MDKRICTVCAPHVTACARVMLVCATAFAALFVPDARAQPPAYPQTPVRPVVQEYHGVAVTDDYRWLEDDKSTEVQAWVAAQNRVTREHLDAIALRPRVAARVEALLKSRATSHYALRYRGGHLFALRDQPPANQPVLVDVLSSGPGPVHERVILDPNTLSAGGHVAIDFYVPSYDGTKVAVSLSENGSEDGILRVYDVASRRALGDAVSNVSYPTAGGSVEWSPDNRGFYYTRYPSSGERPDADLHFFQTVWFHALATPVSDDRYVIGRDFPRIAEIALDGGHDGRHLVAAVRNGDGGDVAFYLRGTGADWTQVAGFTDGVKQLEIGDGDTLFARSIDGAPLGRILAMPAAHPVLADAPVIVSQGRIAIESFVPSHSRLYVKYRDGGPSVGRMFALDGKPIGDIPAEPISEIRLGPVLAGDDILLRINSYRSPPTWFHFDARRRKLKPTRLSGRVDFNFDDAEVVREFAVSKDGTRIPLNILRRKGVALNGRNPVLLYAYGGYGISMEPWFDPMNRLWLDYGGLFVVANVRGGGEYGEPWHMAGKLTRKQNVFDDFAAAMQLLVDRKYTRADRLAIMGGSNGGLTMGAALTQHPAAMRAVVSEVGIYDALRWETQPNGEFNTTEFGSVEDPAQFRALYAYSPLQHVVDRTEYPAVLFTTGDNDGRVAPYESRKMTARLQAATSSSNPILLRTDAAAGHGIGTGLGARIALKTDIYTFLIEQLGMTPVAVPALR